jgi:hypothetical protein
MYLTVGDGGNIEGIYKDYIDGPSPDFCSTPEQHTAQIFPPPYQPQVCDGTVAYGADGLPVQLCMYDVR